MPEDDGASMVTMETGWSSGQEYELWRERLPDVNAHSTKQQVSDLDRLPTPPGLGPLNYMIGIANDINFLG